MKLLIQASIDYADEFNCEMFTVMTEKQWAELQQTVRDCFRKSVDDVFEIGFGTNEQLSFGSFKDWFDFFEVKPISDEDAAFLKKNFSLPFGTGSQALDEEYWTCQEYEE